MTTRVLRLPMQQRLLRGLAGFAGAGIWVAVIKEPATDKLQSTSLPSRGNADPDPADSRPTFA